MRRYGKIREDTGMVEKYMSRCSVKCRDRFCLSNILITKALIADLLTLRINIRHIYVDYLGRAIAFVVYYIHAHMDASIDTYSVRILYVVQCASFTPQPTGALNSVV